MGDFAMRLGHHEIYNALPGIEQANHAIRVQRSFEGLMGELGTVVLHHELEDTIGIRLLHRHNDIGADEIMAENIEPFDDTKALVTARYRVRELPFDVMPTMWACRGDDGLQNLEHSRRDIVSIDRHFLRYHKRF